MKPNRHRWKRAAEVLSLCSLVLFVAAFHIRGRKKWIRAPFVLRPKEYLAVSRQRAPATQVHLVGDTGPVQRVRVEERVILTGRNWPTQYPMYNIGPVILLPDGSLLVGLQGEGRLLRFSIRGDLICEIGEGPGMAPGEIAHPFRARWDGTDSCIWVYSPANGLLQQFTLEGGYLFSTAVPVPVHPVRDFLIDRKSSRVYFSYWDWENRSTIHLYDFQGKHVRSFGRGPYVHEVGSANTERLAKHLGLWENYAAGYLMVDSEKLWFARCNPYEIMVLDTLGHEEVTLFRAGGVVKAAGYLNMGGLSFVGPYTTQVTAFGFVDSLIAVWFVDEEPAGDGSRYRSTLDILTRDGLLLATRSWPELRWVWSFGPGPRFVAARRAEDGDEILYCRFRLTED